MGVLSRRFAALLDLVWPPTCAACGGEAWEGEPRAPLCTPCAVGLEPPRARCPRCARSVGPVAIGAPCSRCAEERWALDGAVAADAYRGTARALVVRLKFRAERAAARVLGARLADAVERAGIPGDLLVPVPLSRRRRRERGFNQAALLAREVAARLALDLDERALVRRRHDAPQSSLPPGRRRRAPRGGFDARAERVRGRCVLLVDDVLTSGATALACARALHRAGAPHVVLAVAARSEAHPGAEREGPLPSRA
jgi:ComF family protein